MKARKPATTIEAAIGVCDPGEALLPGDAYYQDFAPVRKMSLEERIGRRVKSAVSAGRYASIAVAGHMGCGKSTELYCVQAWAEAEGFATIFAQVNEELDPYEVGYSDLMLLLARLLESEFRTRKWPLDHKTLETVQRWFLEITKVSTTEVEASLGASAQLEAGAQLPFFAKLMVALTSSIRAGGSNKTELREKVQRYPKALVDSVNLLLDAVRARLQEHEKQGLLIILDSLDHYRPEVIDKLLIQGADMLKGLNCHIVYTVPISLIYSPKSESVKDRFDTEILPMIKVRERNGDDCEAGIQSLVEALAKRMDLALFADKALARELAKMSGGCVRDLMHLAQTALLASRTRADEEAMQSGFRVVRSEYSREIGAEQYELLARVHLTKSCPNDEQHRTLLWRRDVLEYNYSDDRWADVHPLILGMQEFRDALKQEKKKLGLA